MKLSTKTFLLDQLNSNPFLTAVVAEMRDGWYIFFLVGGGGLNKMLIWADGVEKGRD